MSDQPAAVHFYQGWADTGQFGKDGFPIFEDTVMVQIEKPPLLKLERAAYKNDFTQYREEYTAFQNQQKAKDKAVNEAGYPLVYWPAVTTAEVEMLAVRGIYTVEQLEKIAGNKDLPGRLAELAIRAERMMDMQKQFGKYEALLADREAQLAEATAQLTEMRQQIASQNSIIETLKMRVQ